MGAIKDQTQKLINVILESEEYRNFSTLRDQIREDPALRERLNDFRLHVFEVQNSRHPLDMYAQEQTLGRQYEEFRKDPLVNEFLQAELGICRILQRVTTDIAGAIDLDTDELSERIQI